MKSRISDSRSLWLVRPVGAGRVRPSGFEPETCGLRD